ncbi:hypothetical protein [Streptomyces celluloflavus]|uniref:hypothetical protein n=1 Tax=Streptomyces celluloflavus TaxID=58344 RepID=UPI0036758A47
MICEVPGAEETAAAHCTGHNYSDLGRPRIAWDDEAARERLVNALVTDTVQLLGRQPEQNFGEKAASAVGLPLVKPPPLRPAVPGGFTLDDFRTDTAAGTVTAWPDTPPC